MKNITIYKSYGVLAHEKKPFYSVYAPASDIYDKITVSIPFETWESVSGEIGVTIDGTDYLLSEVLTNYGDKPAASWVDGNKKHYKILQEK